ncbi:MAG TPA: TolC family protein [Pyrinomonadaceae bacterium]|jgi:HAE1 family hydrophobic/amphiphilic exporter-1
MKRYLYLFILILTLAAFGEVRAQDAAPTPSPSPSPTVQPKVDDKQNVQPENLKGVPTVAPDYKQEDTSLPDLGRVGVDMLAQKPLALKEAITLALENNKDIEVTRQNVRIAEFDLQSSRGFYDPRLSGQTYYERSTTPNISFFTPDVTKITGDSIVGNATFQTYIPKFGTVLNVTAANNRVGTDNTISIISPQYNANITATLTQPLFRGRSFDLPRRNIEIAKRNLSLTDTQFRQRSIEIITNVQRAYWDLVYALRNLQVQRDGVRDAKEQLTHNRRLVEEGQLAPIDIVAAETQVANIEQGVYEALETVGRAENALKNLVAQSKDDTLWRESIVPTDSVDLEAPRTTLPEALTLALENRPEIEINKVQKDINDIDQKFYRDQTKPQIDLVASYTSAGVGGSLNPAFTNPLLNTCVQNPNQQLCVDAAASRQRLLENVGGATSSVTDIFTNKYPTFRAGVTFNLPFGNNTAKANLGRSLVQSEQISTQREQIEQTIQVDVRNALQAVRTSEARLRSAAISRENSQKQYESEQRKLDAGQSDVYKVLERQTALITARSNELRAQTELNKSIADLQRATGNSLKANNVEARLRK